MRAKQHESLPTLWQRSRIDLIPDPSSIYPARRRDALLFLKMVRKLVEVSAQAILGVSQLDLVLDCRSNTSRHISVANAAQ